MEDRENIPEIDPEQGLTAQQAAERTPAGTPVYPGKTEQEIILTHCFTFFNLIFVVLAVMLLSFLSANKEALFLLPLLSMAFQDN